MVRITFMGLRKMRKLIPEGGEVLFPYGIAYFDPGLGYYICYPVPINWLVFWGRELWYAVAGRRKRTLLERAERAGYEAGYGKGRKEGLLFGYRLITDFVPSLLPARTAREQGAGGEQQ